MYTTITFYGSTFQMNSTNDKLFNLLVTSVGRYTTMSFYPDQVPPNWVIQIRF
jgi:hypothetical protein